jgi:hypothetical protein
MEDFSLYLLIAISSSPLKRSNIEQNKEVRKCDNLLLQDLHQIQLFSSVNKAFPVNICNVN